jgi:hypothetical protein
MGLPLSSGNFAGLGKGFEVSKILDYRLFRITAYEGFEAIIKIESRIRSEEPRIGQNFLQPGSLDRRSKSA